MHHPNQYNYFGAYLKDVRESMNLSITDIENHINVKRKYLKAIESGDLSSLPGGVYSKGFIRSYASILGLDEKHFAADFDNIEDLEHTSISNIDMGEEHIPSRKIKYFAYVGIAILSYIYLSNIDDKPSLVQEIPAFIKNSLIVTDANRDCVTLNSKAPLPCYIDYNISDDLENNLSYNQESVTKLAYEKTNTTGKNWQYIGRR